MEKSLAHEKENLQREIDSRKKAEANLFSVKHQLCEQDNFPKSAQDADKVGILQLLFLILTHFSNIYIILKNYFCLYFLVFFSCINNLISKKYILGKETFRKGLG